jgi:dipeptidyl aminopeptidase/acylaminoacyl peptidase
MLNLANRLAQEGTAILLVSQPGYGRSEGSPDWAGPATIAALSAALDRLENTPGVDSKRIGIWGISRGATAATLLAAKRPEVRAVVAQSGSYDLWATHRGSTLAAVRESVENEAGRDSSAWKARSPILQAKTIRAQVMVMHGEADDQAPIEQARAFAAALDLRGHPTETNFSETGHNMPPSAQLPAQHFFERTLKP